MTTVEKNSSLRRLEEMKDCYNSGARTIENAIRLAKTYKGESENEWEMHDKLVEGLLSNHSGGLISHYREIES